MDKEKLIKIAKELHQCAFDANSYFLIMQQYRRNWQVYFEEMKSSPAFYQIVYEALIKACFMEIAKLYDTSNGVVSVGTLLAECENSKDLFPEYRDTITIEDGGKKYAHQVRYQHQLKPKEERFFKSEVEASRTFYAVFDIPDAQNLPVRVDLTFSEFLNLYKKRFNGLSKKRKNIRIQRNKLYAHNDEDRIVGDENPADRYPVSYPDIQELIEFALDCTGLIFGVLTGISYAQQYSNIDDWVGTLMLTRLGIKYKDYELKQRAKSTAAEGEKLFEDKGSCKS